MDCLHTAFTHIEELKNTELPDYHPYEGKKCLMIYLVNITFLNLIQYTDNKNIINPGERRAQVLSSFFELT